MSDRFYDRHDNSYNSYEDEYEDRYYGSRLNRSSYSNSRTSGRYSDRLDRPDYSDQATRPARSSGATRSRQGDGSGYRLSQSSDARSASASNLFDDYYSDEDVDAYRRSAYSAGSASSRSASRQRSYQRADVGASPRRSASPLAGGRDVDAAQARASCASGAPRVSGASRSSGASRPSARAATRPSQRAAASADPAPKRSNRKRNLIIAAVAAVAIVLVGVGMAFAYVNSISGNLHDGLDDDVYAALTPTSLGDEAFYMLLLGIDTSVDRVENEEDGDTVRSDSMILARIDPVNKKVALISIDRDTQVDLGEYGTQKINAAFEVGGAAGAVQAVSKMAGVDIAHYASVDFDGFRAIVDALGGVEVDVPVAIDDWMAGGSVDAGWQTLNGDQALILCRSRHTYDDMVAAGDVIRAANQRMVISAIAKKVLSSDLLTIANTVQAMSQYVTTDLEVSDIIGLAQLFKGIDAENDIYTGREPTVSAYVDDIWWELLDEEEWQKMIARMDQGLPPSEYTEVDEATGVVLAASGSAGSAPSSSASGVSGGTAGTGVSSSVQSGAGGSDDDEGYYDDDDDDGYYDYDEDDEE